MWRTWIDGPQDRTVEDAHGPRLFSIVVTYRMEQYPK